MMVNPINQSYFYFIGIFVIGLGISRAISLAINKTISIKIDITISFFGLSLW